MPAETGRVELDAWAVFRKASFLAFIVLQMAAWRRIPARFALAAPGHRLIYFLIHPKFTRQSMLLAPIVGGLVAILAVLVVRYLVRPALDNWLRPRTDPSIGAFHLAAGERVIASVPARKRDGWSWQAGSLVQTDRRVWFFPEAWSMEPWSASRGETRVETEEAWFCRRLPIRNWPNRVVALTLPDRREVLAVSDPSEISTWFSKAEQPRQLLQDNHSRS